MIFDDCGGFVDDGEYDPQNIVKAIQISTIQFSMRLNIYKSLFGFEVINGWLINIVVPI